MLFVWKTSYATGIDQIDEDHKQLVKLINDLYEAMQDGSGGALLLPIFSALKHYTEVHFAKEERYMIACNAPEQANHIQEHEQMVKRLVDLEKRHRQGEAAISLQTLTFLRDWLKNHICAVDQAMAAHSKQHCQEQESQAP
ncbi:MAG: bacteriohemerythrin [Desulfuromonadales bacterium]